MYDGECLMELWSMYACQSVLFLFSCYYSVRSIAVPIEPMDLCSKTVLATTVETKYSSERQPSAQLVALMMPLDRQKEMVQEWPQISHSNWMEPHFTRGLGSKLSTQGRTLDSQIALEHFLHYPNTKTPQQTFGLSLYLIVAFISLWWYRPWSNLNGENYRKG